MMSLRIYLFFSLQIILYFIEVNSNPNESPHPIVMTKCGQIKGSVFESRLGRNFLGFRGIRYGKSPVGKLRFRAPQPVDMWHDVFDATEPGPMCPQLMQPDAVWSEDCLRLSVYTHELPQNTSSSIKKPVIVYVPGGGFLVGSGVSNHYSGPQYLMDRDVIFVAINYRLGALGFLSLGTKDVPGNAAIKDQILALRWIRDNIEYFGGNPNQVTVLGNSAGGLTLSVLMTSPMAQGLFHRAILMSGSVIEHPKAESHQQYLALRLSKHFKCSGETPKCILECLMRKSAKELIESQHALYEIFKCPTLTWMYVLEPDFGQERLFFEEPYESMLNGDYMKIPIIIGITRDELVGVGASIVSSETVLNFLDMNFNDMIPVCLNYERDTPTSNNISNTLWNGYNFTHPLSEEDSFRITQLFSDSIIGSGVHRMVDMLHDQIDIFYYKFSYQGRYSHAYTSDGKPVGVSHSDDMFYLFKKHTAPLFTDKDLESEMVEVMTRLWVQFATTGNPTNASDLVIGKITWPKIDTDKKYLEINTESTVKEHMFEERYKIWDSLWPLERSSKPQ